MIYRQHLAIVETTNFNSYDKMSLLFFENNSICTRILEDKWNYTLDLYNSNQNEKWRIDRIILDKLAIIGSITRLYYARYLAHLGY